MNRKHKNLTYLTKERVGGERQEKNNKAGVPQKGCMVSLPKQFFDKKGVTNIKKTENIHNHGGGGSKGIKDGKSSLGKKGELKDRGGGVKNSSLTAILFSKTGKEKGNFGLDIN